MKYQMGDKVWYAKRRYVERTKTCPDCDGTRALTVIMGDESRVSIECVGCKSGYEPPKGYIKYGEYVIDVCQVIIEGIEIKKDGVEYRHSERYSCPEDDLFVTKVLAEKRASDLAKQHNAEELEKVNKKEKPTHTWAWNATYHRREIKRAEKDLAYHTAKLTVAKVKADIEKAKKSEAK